MSNQINVESNKSRIESNQMNVESNRIGALFEFEKSSRIECDHYSNSKNRVESNATTIRIWKNRIESNRMSNVEYSWECLHGSKGSFVLPTSFLIKNSFPPLSFFLFFPSVFALVPMPIFSFFGFFQLPSFISPPILNSFDLSSLLSALPIMVSPARLNPGGAVI
jgi:hypothetical protein